MINKILAMLMLPIALLGLLIDISVGDIVCGCTTQVSEKIANCKNRWLDY